VNYTERRFRFFDTSIYKSVQTGKLDVQPMDVDLRKYEQPDGQRWLQLRRVVSPHEISVHDFAYEVRTP
jgi:hypothetical protein